MKPARFLASVPGALSPGETMIAGVLAEQRSITVSNIFGLVGALAGRMVRSATRQGRARSFPGMKQTYVVVTDRRLVVVVDTGVFQPVPKIVAEYVPREIARISVRRSRFSSRLTISFVDGSSVTLASAMKDECDEVAAAFPRVMGLPDVPSLVR